MRSLAVLFVLASTALVGIGCGDGNPVAPPKEDPAKAVFEAKCAECHPLTKIGAYEGEEAWPALVTRMIDERGAKIASDEADGIVGYLEKTFPRAQP